MFGHQWPDKTSRWPKAIFRRREGGLERKLRGTFLLEFLPLQHINRSQKNFGK